MLVGPLYLITRTNPRWPMTKLYGRGAVFSPYLIVHGTCPLVHNQTLFGWSWVFFGWSRLSVCVVTGHKTAHTLDVNDNMLMYILIKLVKSLCLGITERSRFFVLLVCTVTYCWHVQWHATGTYSEWHMLLVYTVTCRMYSEWHYTDMRSDTLLVYTIRSHCTTTILWISKHLGKPLWRHSVYQVAMRCFSFYKTLMRPHLAHSEPFSTYIVH